MQGAAKPALPTESECVVTQIGPTLESTGGDLEGAIQALGAAGIAAAEPYFVSDDGGASELAAIFTVPDGYKTHTVDLEALRAPYRPGPIRKRGAYTVSDVNSFLSYYIKHAEMSAEIWANKSEIVAVLNANDAVDERAGWEDHRVVLQLVHSVEWKRWITVSGRLYPQDDFADFLEGAAADIITPDMATVLEVAQSLEATTKVDFESAYRTQDGQRAFKYKETTQARAGQKGELEIPDRFVLDLRIYEGQDPIRVTARFRYRISNESLQLGIVIDHVPEIIETALVDVRETLSAGIDRGTIFSGVAPGSAPRR